MIITNKLNLPKPFESFVSKEYQYQDKRYSVTSILKGLKESILLRRHHNEIEQDVADMIWLLFGTAVHKVLEDSEEERDELKETKITVEMPNGYTLSGQQDLYSESLKRITDYKTGSVWKVIYDDWDDYRLQILAYAWMFRKHGFNVDNGEIVMILKDWSQTKAKTDKSYPQHNVFIKHFDFTEKDFDNIEKLLNDKFSELEELEKLSDDEIPECTPEERWAEPTKYAVMKEGRKSAMKVCDSKEEAILCKREYEQCKGKYYIEERKGTDRKCCDYCQCNKYCHYYKEKYERGFYQSESNLAED